MSPTSGSRSSTPTSSSKSSKTSAPSTSSSSKRQGSQQSLCVELSVDYSDYTHPVFVEAYGCYPLERDARWLTKKIEDFLLDKLIDMFGFQILAIISDSGVYYVDYPTKEGVIIWHHGKDRPKTETFTIEL